ncbi:MAG: GntR family transcriptional regulator [Terracidiphilus sp.]
MQTSIVISQTDGRPMYLQIMEQIRQRVGTGEWRPGEQIPSIRALAITLQVSVITVKRAYLELEREGVIVTQHGKGSIVAPDPHLGPRLYREEFEEHLRQVSRIAALLGMTEEEIVEKLRGAALQLETEES